MSSKGNAAEAAKPEEVVAPKEKPGTISLIKHLESGGGKTLKAKVGSEEHDMDVRRACIMSLLEGSEILRQRQNARGEPPALSMKKILRVGILYGKMENDKSTCITLDNSDKDLILMLGHLALPAVVLTALVSVLDPGQLSKVE